MRSRAPGSTLVVMAPRTTRRRAVHGDDGLEAMWYVALDCAEDALTAGLRSRSLSRTYCAKEFELLREERRWLAQAHFD